MEFQREGRELLLTIFVFSLLLSGLVIYATEKMQYYNRRDRVSRIAAIQAGKIQMTINILLQKTQTLKMLVLQGKGDVPNFEALARELLDEPSINSLQLAPGGVITHIYPPVRARKLSGIFDNPERALEANLAKNSGVLTLAGPYALEQGGFGIVGRQPIYIPDKSGRDAFWGFASIVLILPDVLYPSGLQELKRQGFDYTLHRIRPDTHTVQFFAKSSERPLNNPVETSFQLPNTSWTLRVAPQNGWFDLSVLASEMGIALVVCVLFTTLGYAFLAVHNQKLELKRLTLTDPLTGLPNRRKLQDFLRKRCAQSRAPFLLCLADLDHFREINDTFGHAWGDQLLIDCTRRFQRCLGPGDLLFRIGGDEFVTFLEGGENARWPEKERALQSALEPPVLIEQRPVRVGLSLGRAVYPKDSEDGEKLLRTADNRMYRQKTKRKENGQLPGF